MCIRDSHDSVAIGANAKNHILDNKQQHQVAIGNLANSNGEGSLALGWGAHSLDNAISIGTNSRSGQLGISIGAGANGTTDSISIGRDAHIENAAEEAVSLGRSTWTGYNGGVAIGAFSVSRRAGVETDEDKRKAYMGSEEIVRNTFVRGANATSTEKPGGKPLNGIVSIGGMDWDDPEHHFTRQLTGLAAGTQDTDAVNVAQLKAVAKYANMHLSLIHISEPTRPY